MAETTGPSSSSSEAAHPTKEYTCICFEVNNLVSSIKANSYHQPEKLTVSSISSSIFRVPQSIRRHDEIAYTPKVISIGPFHHDKRKNELKFMEEHKRWYMQNVISKKGEGFLKKCLIAVKELEEKTRKCYSEKIDLDSNSFVEMMVLDACFMIEIFRKRPSNEVDDPVSKFCWLRRDLAMDFVLLENQIPFFILQRLFDLMAVPDRSLKKVALEYFKPWPVFDPYTVEGTNNSTDDIQHLLHLLHENLVFSIEIKDPPSQGPKPIPSASKLQESGVKLTEKGRTNGLLAINFEPRQGVLQIPRQGVLQIPPIEIEDATNILFRNVIAFEQCYIRCRKHATAYTWFMDRLVNSDKDVEILCDKNVIVNNLESDEAVAKLFNNMNKDVILFGNDFYLLGVCNDINDYCKDPWPKFRAVLIRDYFKNPWTTISFFAALLLLLLTMTQTFFSSFPKFALDN